MTEAHTATTPGERAAEPRPHRPWRVLLVHDAGDEADEVLAGLERGAPGARIVRVDSLPALEAALRGRDWDAAFVAERLERMSFETCLNRLSRLDPDMPIVATTRDVDAAFAMRAAVAGARDVADLARPESVREALEAVLRARERDRTPTLQRLDGAEPHLRSLARIARELSHATSFHDALDFAVTRLGSELDLPYLESWVLDDDGARFTPGPAHQVEAAFATLRDVPGAIVFLGRAGLVRHTALNRSSRTLLDLSTDEAALCSRAQPALELGLCSVHATPITRGRRTLAVMLAFTTRTRPFSDGDLVTLDAVAAQLSHAALRLERERTLRGERERIAALLDHVADGIMACDAEGRLTLVNRAMEVLYDGAFELGSGPEAWAVDRGLLLQDGVTAMPPERVPLMQALRGASFEDAEHMITPVTGRRRVVRASGQPIRGDDGAISGAVVAVRDVTDRAAAEAAAGAATTQALRTYSLLLDDLADLARRIGEARSLAEVWRAVLEFAHHTLKADELTVGRTGADGSLTPLFAGTYGSSGGLQAEVAADPALGEALQRCVREGAVVVERVAAAPEGPEASVHSIAAVPMVLGGRVLGGFEIRSYTLGAFDETSGVALSMAANLAAVAIDHEALVDGERRAREAAEVAAQHFGQIFHSSPAAVSIASLLDDRIIDTNPAMEALLGYRRDELVGRRAMDLGIWPDSSERDAVTATARTVGTVRGAEVHLQRKDGAVRSCLLSADVTTLDGENALLMLIVDVTERLEQQRRLHNLAHFRESLMEFIGETLDVGFDGPFYQRLLQSAVDATPGAQAGALLVRDAEGDDYRFVAAVGHDLGGLKGITFFDSEIAAADVEGMPVVTNPLATASEESDRAAALRRFGRLHEIRSTLTVPIFLEGRRVAALTLDNFDDEGAFDEESLQFAAAFATQVATLIKRRELERELEHMAYHDSLTGLPNRVLFRDRLQQAINRSLRTQRRGAAIFIDLDNLKVTNDALGHSVGDRLLKAVAQRLTASIRADDTVARIGGDEFTMVLPDVGGASSVAAVAEKILLALRHPFSLHGHEVHVTASIGITLFPDDATDADSLIQHGDAAMYQAKAQGKDCYRFFTRELNLRLLERAWLESQLRKALERRELSLHFQPRVRLSDGRITSVEALARWRHPERGWVPPGTFIPIAEECGLIAVVGAHLLRLACRQGQAWSDAGRPITVAFNLSAKQLQEPDLVRTVRSALDDTGLSADLLELELTESALMHDMDENVVKLNELRALGVSISIDDFGTAYSSLNYLKRLPATALKIDRSFVLDVERPGATVRDSAIVRAVVALATALGLTTIAEGVETEDQLRFLRSVGCEQGQGYLFARPARPEALAALLHGGSIDLPA